MSARPATPAARSLDLRLARLHVRGGAYALARVELEARAGGDGLDADGILDLAEVRWRTGDLAGAAAAATAWLDEAPGDPGPGPALAHVICAEAAAERGDTEAIETHVAAAAAWLDTGPALAALLAGIPPRAAWPWPAHPEPPDGAVVTADGAADAEDAVVAAGAAAAAAGLPAARPRGVPLATAAAALLEAGGARLAAEPERGAVLLALALRADRAAAEAVLATLDAAALPAEPAGAPAAPGSIALAFVRAEALRAAGRPDEARIAYASAERLALAPAEAGPPGSPQ